MIVRILLFLLINFGALAIGSFFTGKGVSTDWYENLNKAPWTPPGWSFGLAWTTIMICFSIYLAYLWPHAEDKSILITAYTIQWVLNVAWNPVFFRYHQTAVALLVILALTCLVGFFLFYYWHQIKWLSVLVLPYFIWLLIASSLNGYIVLKN